MRRLCSLRTATRGVIVARVYRVLRPAPPLVVSFAFLLLLAVAPAHADPINVLLQSETTAPCIVMNEWHWGQLPTSHVVCMKDERETDGPLTDSGVGAFSGAVSWMVVPLGNVNTSPSVMTLSGPAILFDGGGIDGSFTSATLLPDIPSGTPTIVPGIVTGVPGFEPNGESMPLFSTNGIQPANESAFSTAQEAQLNPVPTLDSLDPMTPTPEPGSLLLMGSGLLLAWRACQKR